MHEWPSEQPVDATIPVIDAHHHLVGRGRDFLVHTTGKPVFLVDDYADFVGSTHNVIASVAVEMHSMYRAGGPHELRSVNETVFLDGQAAMSATGLYGDVHIAAGIVAGVELQTDAVQRALQAHLVAAPERLRGVRQSGFWDADPAVAARLFGLPRNFYLDEEFRRGVGLLVPLGLSFDAMVLSPQLPDVLDLARSFPELSIVLNHLGNPVGIGSHATTVEEDFAEWRVHMAKIAECENVTVKMGGLGTFLSGSPNYLRTPPADSTTLAEEWRSWTEETIGLFGADRVMFESNAPSDCVGPFATVCNAYQRITAGCSEDERRAIFAGTAARVYRLDLV